MRKGDAEPRLRANRRRKPEQSSESITRLEKIAGEKRARSHRSPRTVERGAIAEYQSTDVENRSIAGFMEKREKGVGSDLSGRVPKSGARGKE